MHTKNKIHGSSVLGYNDFNFFLQNGASQAVDGCQIEFQDTFIKYVFSKKC